MQSRWLGFLLAMLLGGVATSEGAGFSVHGRQILREGHPFQIRGVCYQPTPIGANPAEDEDRGDYFTARHAALIARDLPIMRALGATVIRVYNWRPEVDHRAFLDACYNGGDHPLFVLVNRWVDPGLDWGDATVVAGLRREFLQIDAELADHPAVLGLVIGNEANARHGNGENPAFWSAMQAIAAGIKAQTPGRLVSMAVTDAMPQLASVESRMDALDFWCVQAYRGASFGSFFDDYRAVSHRPLVLTEFGIDAFDQRAGRPYPDNARFVGTVVAGLWREIAAHGSICAGGCVFEYADEWWKSHRGNAAVHDVAGVPLESLPDGSADEEWWGIHAVEPDPGSPVNRLVPRATAEALRRAWANQPSQE